MGLRLPVPRVGNWELGGIEWSGGGSCHSRFGGEEAVEVCAATRVGLGEEFEGGMVDGCLGGGRVEDDAVGGCVVVEEGRVRSDVEGASQAAC